NPHDRNGCLLQLAQHQRMIAERRQQNNPFQTQLPEQCIDLLFNVRALYVPGLHHQVHTGLATALDGTGLKFAQIVARPVAKQSDEKGSIACQAARVQIRPIIEPFDGLEDAVARIQAHAWLIVDDPRHRLRRHLREIGHLLNRHRGANESHIEILNQSRSRAYWSQWSGLGDRASPPSSSRMSAMVRANRPPEERTNGASTSLRSAPAAVKHLSGTLKRCQAPGRADANARVRSNDAPSEAPHRASVQRIV